MTALRKVCDDIQIRGVAAAIRKRWYVLLFLIAMGSQVVCFESTFNFVHGHNKARETRPNGNLMKDILTHKIKYFVV